MKLGENLPPGHDALLFLIGGTGSFICPFTHTRLGIPRPLFTHASMDQEDTRRDEEPEGGENRRIRRGRGRGGGEGEEEEGKGKRRRGRGGGEGEEEEGKNTEVQLQIYFIMVTTVRTLYMV